MHGPPYARLIYDSLMLPIMCKGMYDFLDNICRTENRQESRMCKHSFRRIDLINNTCTC